MRLGPVLAFCESASIAAVVKAHFERHGYEVAVQPGPQAGFPNVPYVVRQVEAEATHALSWDRGYLKYRKRLVEAAKGGIANPDRSIN